uniref:Myosin light chain kinase family member 4 n=1 Tax=Amazona collaria TaxID=241587 RepID=A0A8B9FEJ4_9PSIT
MLSLFRKDNRAIEMEPSRERIISDYHWLIHVFFFPLRGRFGQVHKCEEKSTGLKLAAKIIKAKGPKQKVGRIWGCQGQS